MALALLAAAPAGAQQGGGLARIVAAAAEYNANLQGRRARLENEREGESIALSDLLPQISGSATFPDGKFGEDRESYAVGLSQQVLNVALWRNWSAEKRGTAAAEADFSAARQGLRLTVSSAWLQAQLARETLRLTEARRETVEEQFKRARALEDAGEGTRVDVLSSRARADLVRAEWVSARNDWKTARANVARLTGISPEAAALSDSYVPPDLPRFSSWLEKTLAEANEIAAARARVEQARLRTKAANAAWIPRVVFSMPLWEESASGGGGNNNNNNDDEDFTIRVEQTFFTGGRVMAERRRLLAQLREVEAQLLELERNLRNSARERHQDAGAALERVRALRTAEDSARAALESVIIGYEAGVRIVADVLNAEEALFDAQVQLSRAQYDHITALVGLRALAGALDDELSRRWTDSLSRKGKTRGSRTGIQKINPFA